MKLPTHLEPIDLLPAAAQVCELAVGKVKALARSWDARKGAAVVTVKGKYTSRAWTQWTQGFQFGCALLAFDATDDDSLYELGRRSSFEHMLDHVTHTGVHDHGFHNVSTFGNLRRLIREKRAVDKAGDVRVCETALRVSGAVQAMRWTFTADDPPDTGYVYSFNGPHSLFIDTMRTLRVLGVAHQLGHTLLGENDEPINLLGRACHHALTTAKHLVFHGDSGHAYDQRGRTAHEGVFNLNDGQFRNRSTQQGYSPFSTWTRGLAWAMLGFAEQLEFLSTLSPRALKAACGLAKSDLLKRFEQTARNLCDHYIDDCAALDGMVYWDTGAPGLAKLDDWRRRAADPFNAHEPVDSSAAVIAAQGLIRLGRHLGAATKGQRYLQAGLAVAKTLFGERYLATDPKHQGLLLHSVYHRPNGWDHVPKGQRVPCGESSMWGDYHALELAILIRRIARREVYPTFFDQ